MAVEFVVYQVALRQVFLPTIWFFPSVSFHQSPIIIIIIIIIILYQKEKRGKLGNLSIKQYSSGIGCIGKKNNFFLSEFK